MQKDDMISRQAAIDAVDSLSDEPIGYLECAIDVLADLPSVQPELIRCKDCKHVRKWRSEESAKKFGQIYECARGVFNCPKPEDFCSHAERRTDD